MTNQPKDIGPKQLAWLKRRIPEFKETRAKVGEVVMSARDKADEALAAAAEANAPAQAIDGTETERAA